MKERALSEFVFSVVKHFGPRWKFLLFLGHHSITFLVIPVFCHSFWLYQEGLYGRKVLSCMKIAVTKWIYSKILLISVHTRGDHMWCHTPHVAKKSSPVPFYQWESGSRHFWQWQRALVLELCCCFTAILKRSISKDLQIILMVWFGYAWWNTVLQIIIISI